MEYEYGWKNKNFYKADPQKVGEEIETLGDTFDPADVLELARNPESESHKCFTWDDSKAAEKCRLQEARQLLCQLEIVTIKSDTKESIKIPIELHRANEYDGKHYGPIQFIVETPDRYQSLLQQCKKDLRELKAKYGYLKELQNVWDVID